MKRFFVIVALTGFSPAYANCLSSNPDLYDFTGYYTGATKTNLTLTSPSRTYDCVLQREGDQMGRSDIGPSYGSTQYFKCSNGATFEMGSNSYNRRIEISIAGQSIELEPKPFKETCKSAGFGTTSCVNRIQKVNCSKTGEQLVDTWQFSSQRGEIFTIKRISLKEIKSNSNGSSSSSSRSSVDDAKVEKPKSYYPLDCSKQSSKQDFVKCMQNLAP